MWVDAVQILLIGVTLGAAYALLALAINVVYATSNVLNFAMGELMMLGGMLGWFFVSELGAPYWLGFLVAIAGAAAVGAAEYWLAVWPLMRRGAALVVIAIATLGFSVVVRIATSITFGNVQRFAQPPLGQDAVRLGGVTLLPQYGVIVGVTAAALLVLWWLYSRTTLGLALRAAALEPDGARLVGVRVSAVVLATFAAGGALAGVAGLVLSPLSYASPWVGLQYSILGFAAAIVGGLGSWPGSVVGGLVLGVTQALVFRYVSPAWGDLITFALMLGVLYLRPNGIFRDLQFASAWSR